MIVPLLILWLAYEDREATGTSLAAIVVIAAFGAGAHGALRQRRPAGGRCSSARRPWAASWRARRCSSGSPSASCSGAFAVLLVVSAAVLIF